MTAETEARTVEFRFEVDGRTFALAAPLEGVLSLLREAEAPSVGVVVSPWNHPPGTVACLSLEVNGAHFGALFLDRDFKPVVADTEEVP